MENVLFIVWICQYEEAGMHMQLINTYALKFLEFYLILFLYKIVLVFEIQFYRDAALCWEKWIQSKYHAASNVTKYLVSSF